jgi:hypothetical protein
MGQGLLADVRVSQPTEWLSVFCGRGPPTPRD